MRYGLFNEALEWFIRFLIKNNAGANVKLKKTHGISEKEEAGDDRRVRFL